MAARTKKQMQIKGTEPRAIAEVDTAAEAYVEARDARMKLTEKEVEAQDKLLEVMAKHKLSIYRDETAVPALLVIVTPGKSKAKVKRVEEEEGEGPDAGGED